VQFIHDLEEVMVFLHHLDKITWIILIIILVYLFFVLSNNNEFIKKIEKILELKNSSDLNCI